MGIKFPVSFPLRSMVECAKAWAEKNGLKRCNPVHGKDEYRVPTEFNFAHASKDLTRTRASARTTVEAGLRVFFFSVEQVQVSSAWVKLPHFLIATAAGCQGSSCGVFC